MDQEQETLAGGCAMTSAGGMTRVRLASAVFVAACIAGNLTTAVAQESVTLEGTIRDARTQQPLSGVTVTLLDSGAESRTTRWGVYRLECDTLAEINVRLVVPGYATSVERIALRGNRTIADFNMSPVDAILEALIVEDENPAAIDSAAAGVVRMVGLDDAVRGETSDLLKDVPGVLIVQPSGQVGAGKKIQLRGVRSLFAGSEPIVFVDGLRVMSSSSRLSGTRGENPLDLIPMSDIDRIEIFKGPAASARYGTGALSGVIHIYTKRGPERRPY